MSEEIEAERESSTGDGVDSRYRTYQKSTVVRRLVALHVIAMVAAVLPEPVPGVVTAPPVILALTFVPGALAVLLLFDDLRVSARAVLYTLGLSLIILLGIGLVINLSLPLVGIERPLSVAPLGVSITLVVGGLALGVYRKASSEKVSVSFPLPLSPAAVILPLLPLASILAVTYLNVTINTFPILALLAVFAVVPLVAVLWFDVRWHSYTVLSLALAILYHKSFWKNYGFSGSPGVIRAWQEMRWSPGVTEVQSYSTELLENGVLFPTYARLSGITIITELEVVNPFLVAFIPLAIFVVARDYFGYRHGLLAAALFAFAHPFYMQYPAAGRAATPVLFLSLFAVVLTDDDLSPVQTSILGIPFVSGIVVSHYGTSYFVMFAILGALVLLVGLHLLDEFLDNRLGWAVPDGGVAITDTSSGDSLPEKAHSALSWPLGVYYTIGAIGWYMYATQGDKFRTLPNHIIGSINSLLGDEIVSGRTGARLQRDYGSLSIRLSKYMYIILGLLMGIGIALAFYRRYFKRDRSLIDDEYVVLASIMLAIFGSTFVARSWGGGRPMMITLTFTSPFAVLCALTLVRFVRSNVSRFLKLNVQPLEIGRDGSVGLALFGILLALLFTLNSGFASAAVVGGESPSNVPWGEAQDSGRQIDIAAHGWVSDHGTGNAYGDYSTFGQTDWFLPEIAMETSRDWPYGSEINKPRGDLPSLQGGSIEPGYVMLLTHNIDDQEIVRYTTFENLPLQELESELERRNKVYSTGRSEIYYAPPNSTLTGEGDENTDG